MRFFILHLLFSWDAFYEGGPQREGAKNQQESEWERASITGQRFDHDGDDEGEKKIVFTSSFFFLFFSYNKPENEPGTRKKKNVNEARDGGMKKKHIVKWKKRIFRKQVLFREWFQSNWIQLRDCCGERESGAIG